MFVILFRLISDDCWSYTNFSSSQASDSESVIEREEREDVCWKEPKDGGENETKKVNRFTQYQ